MSIWRLVKPHVKYYVDILKARWLRWLNRTDCCVWLYQKKLWQFMFEMHLISGITDGWQGCEPHPHIKLNVKTRPLLACILVFIILLVLVVCCFLTFSECFPVIPGFCLAVLYRTCYCFSTIFWVLASSLQLSIPWLKILVMSLHLIKARLYCR